MRSVTTITMKNGDKIAVDDYEANVTALINAARGENVSLIRLETPRTPRGQMVAIDPNEVAIVIGDSY